MNISALLFYVDHRRLVLPCFARDYAWNPTQVRRLFDALYRGYPVGSLILWSVPADAASTAPEVPTQCSRVEAIVDGHQRIASIYGVLRGRPTGFRRDAAWSLPPLKFHVADQVFDFEHPGMANDPLWIDLNDLGSRGEAGIGQIIDVLYKSPGGPTRIVEYMPRVAQLCRILNRSLAIENVPSDADADDVAAIHRIANGARD